MATVTLVFVGGNSTVDKVIQEFSHGDVTHAAIKILGSVCEAKGMKEETDLYPGFWPHDPVKYDQDADAHMVVVDVPDLAGAEAEARRLIGTPYGYIDCVRGGTYDNTGIQIPGNDLTVNCSEAVTRILRAGGWQILNGVEADCVTPVDLYKAVAA